MACAVARKASPLQRLAHHMILMRKGRHRRFVSCRTPPAIDACVGAVHPPRHTRTDAHGDASTRICADCTRLSARIDPFASTSHPRGIAFAFLSLP
jgi:hypothetical protein